MILFISLRIVKTKEERWGWGGEGGLRIVRMNL